MLTGPRLNLQILGPVSASRDGLQVLLGPRLQRAVLAVLLCRANRPVFRKVLVEALWDGRAPHTGPKNVQKYIYGLRQALDTAERISHGPQGYTLHAAADELDLLRFRKLTDAGRRARAQGADAAAAALWAQALDEWGGELDVGLAQGAGLDQEFQALERERLAVFEDWAEAQLDAGDPGQVAEKAAAMAAAHPLRERLRAAQIRALYACGRQREALGAYDDLRQQLARELGLEPSPPLAALYHSLLERPELRPVRSAQIRRPVHPLPRDLPDFTDRGTLLTQLHAATEPGALAVAWGPAGMGKTVSALRVAHQSAHRFPGGRIFVRLDDAADTTVALRRLFLAAGLGEEVPTQEQEAAELWRAWLSHRRMLVILDGPRSEREVRPLLPQAGPATVLITARSRLAGLQQARRIRVGALHECEATDLLGRVAGTARVHAQPDAARRIVGMVGYSALGVRAAGMRLAAQPNLPLGVFAGRLESPAERLERLRNGDVSLHEVMNTVAGQLPDHLHTALTVLACDAPEDFSTADAAQALRCEPAAVEGLLDELLDAGTLAVAGDDDEVTTHDFLFRIPLLLRLALRAARYSA